MSVNNQVNKAIRILHTVVGFDEEETPPDICKGSLEEQAAYYVAKRMVDAVQQALTEDVYAAKKLSSPIESMMYLRLREIQLEFFEDMKFTPQVKIGTYTVDFLVERKDVKVVIECDGHDFHEKTKQQAQHDKKRDRYLTSKGYRLFRYTGSEIYNGKIDVWEDLFSVFFESNQ